MPELPEMENIIHSGELAAGKYTDEFEKRLASFFDEKMVIVTSGFNMAVSVVISTIELKAGDEVVASPMACLSSTQPFATAGIKVVWADIDPATGTLDPESVRKSISDRTRLIVNNHFCGYPGYIDEINDIGNDYGIYVADDGVECFGTRYHDRLIGHCDTDFTYFSFNPVRIPNTIDGGAIVFKDESLFQKALLIRDCGINRKCFRDDMGEINPNADVAVPGYSATMSNVNAYIGIRQMEEINGLIDKQRKNAGKWDDRIGGMDSIRPVSTVNGVPNYWVYGAITSKKEEYIKEFRNMGYYASGVHINNSIYSVFGKQWPLPGAEAFGESFLALPCGWWVEDEQI